METNTEKEKEKIIHSMIALNEKKFLVLAKKCFCEIFANFFIIISIHFSPFFYHTHTHTHTYIYIYICMYATSSSSCRTRSTDIPDPLLQPLPIVCYFRQVFRTKSRIGTELLNIGSGWSFYSCSSMWRGPSEYVSYEFVLTSPAMSRMSGSSNFESFHDGW